MGINKISFIMPTAEQISTFIGNLFDEMEREPADGFLAKEEIHEILKKFHANHGAGNEFNEEMFEGAWAKISKGEEKIDMARLQEAAITFSKKNGIIEE